jgi:hypothetical protein
MVVGAGRLAGFFSGRLVSEFSRVFWGITLLFGSLL